MKKIEIEQPAFNNSGPRLDNFLATHLPDRLQQPISKGQVRKLIIAGAVYLNGHRTRIASKPVFAGSRVVIHVDVSKLGPSAGSADPDFVMSPDHILYEDDNLIIVNKPCGLPTQPTVDRARNNMFTELQKYLKSTRNHDYVGLHHRLDRDTSGLLLFTKTKDLNRKISDLFQNREIQKSYLAWVDFQSQAPKIHDSFQIENHLGKDTRSKINKFRSVKSGGDIAQTAFQVLAVQGHLAKVLCEPKTGRTHQIRVHLSEYGWPILGDRLYGTDPETSTRLHLHAWRLNFLHPLTQEPIQIEAPVPKDLPNW